MGSVALIYFLLKDTLTSHSWRRGAAKEAELHKDVTTTVVGHRGGWTLYSINRIFCCITMNAKGDTICARALSNWPDGTSGGFLPTILFTDEVDRNEIREISLSLMGSSVNLFTESARMALTILILRFHMEFQSEFPNHNLVTRITECSQHRGLRPTAIAEWCEKTNWKF